MICRFITGANLTLTGAVQVNLELFCRHWQHRWECWTAGWVSTDVKTRGWPMSSQTSRRSTWARKSSTGDVGVALTFSPWGSWTVVFILRVISQNRASTRLQADQLEALPPLNNRSNFTGGGFRLENPLRRWCLIKVHLPPLCNWNARVTELPVFSDHDTFWLLSNVRRRASGNRAQFLERLLLK